MDAKSFRQSYLDTIYRVRGIGFILSDENKGQILFSGQSFGLVTAANPRSRELSKEENDKRNVLLEEKMTSLGLNFDKAYGTDAQETWCEDGFVVWNCEVSLILSLGREFEQNAIVFGQESRVALGWCKGNQLEWFWPELISKQNRI